MPEALRQLEDGVCKSPLLNPLPGPHLPWQVPPRSSAEDVPKFVYSQMLLLSAALARSGRSDLISFVSQGIQACLSQLSKESPLLPGRAEEEHCVCLLLRAELLGQQRPQAS